MPEPRPSPSATRSPVVPNEGPLVDWSLLSPQGRVIFYIALCPGCTVSEIAEALDMSERNARYLLADLQQDDMLIVDDRERRHTYRVNLEAPLLHPTIEGLTLKPVLGRLVEEAEQEDSAICVSDDGED